MQEPSDGDIQAYVSNALHTYYDLVPTRLSDAQSIRLSRFLKILYRQAYDRGYRIGQEELAAQVLT